MPTIKVLNSFSLRLNSETPKRDFIAGKDEILSKEEATHWFIKGVIEDGRAILVPDAKQAEETNTDADPVVPSREELDALTVAALKDIATTTGILLDVKANKSEIIDTLLSEHEGKRLVKNADAFYELKEI